MVSRPDAEAGFASLAAWSQDVRAEVRRLDPTQTRILQMIYFERRTHDEVARELSLSPRIVARSLAAAMQTVGLLMMAANPD